MSASSTWWFAGDLHLDPAGQDPRGLEDAFSGFVDRVVLRSLAPNRHLVLLGDTFELRRVRGAGEHAETIQRTASAFPGVFDALRRSLDAGVGVHLVCGNHDYPLMSPAGRDAVGRLLGGAARSGRGAGAQVHPWLLHRAGLFYAEHGNQHHELNRLPQVLLAGQDGGVDRIPATVLEEWERRRGQRVPLRGLAAVGALRAAAGAEREAHGREYERLLDELEGHQLPVHTVRGVHALSRFGTTRALVRTGRRMAARLRGCPDHDSYLRSAAARIDELVLGTGVQRPVCYVFGHTHVEALTELGGGAWYANTGTWSRHVRHDRVLHRFPFVVVEEDTGGRPAVRLDYWDAALRKVVCPAVADGGYRRLADTFRP